MDDRAGTDKVGQVESPAPDRRWPRSVYGTGEEPDYRFSMANERTFLAWIRTSLALLAAGVAVDALPTGYPEPLTRTAAGFLSVVALLSAVMAWRRWARVERAVREDRPIGGMRTGLVLAGAVLLMAVFGLILAVAV